jgi:VWFA-related protein
MTTRAGIAIAMVAAALLAAMPLAARQAPQTPQFHSTTATVNVSASVKRANSAVANLTAADFIVTDNGVPQTIEAVSIETVPIDVTLFLDTSGSTAGHLDDMKKDVQTIVQFLRADDKFRLLTIGDSVYESVPWVPAGTKVELSFGAVGGISLIRDALMLAMLHRVEPGRRHLIVGMTDRQDCGSVIPAKLFFEMAGRTDAVIHVVDYSGGGGDSRYRVRACTPRGAQYGVAAIDEAAERTGGELHNQSRFFRASSIAREFRTIFDDFRQSYVLRYSPDKVPMKGWHAIKVTVPGVKNAVVHARQGYYGD